MDEWDGYFLKITTAGAKISIYTEDESGDRAAAWP